MHLSSSIPPTHSLTLALVFCLSGESGLGKSTLINSLFLTDLYSPEYPGPSHRIKKTVQVNDDFGCYDSAITFKYNPINKQIFVC